MQNILSIAGAAMARVPERQKTKPNPATPTPAGKIGEKK